MRVIFLQDIDRVGHEGEMADVADGFARNYLIPRKLAVKATKGAERELEQRAASIARRDADKRSQAQALAAQLAGTTVVVKAIAGEGSRLHGQVTSLMIADAIKAQLNYDLDRRDVEIPEPIRLVGDYLIGARLYKDIKAQLPISVIAERRDYNGNLIIEEEPEVVEEAVEEEVVEEVADETSAAAADEE